MAQRSHVPKFGNWDGDNVPYTAYFENARKEKVGAVRINPNDPEQNPEAFNFNRGASYGHVSNSPVTISPDNHEVDEHKQKHKHKDDSSRTNLSSGSSSSANPVVNVKTKHQHKKSGSPNLPGPNHADDSSYRSVSVPKFGQWEENDPRSAEGFTVIFNKVKEEKHIAAAKFPALPLQTTNNYQASQEKETRKKCCCLF